MSESTGKRGGMTTGKKARKTTRVTPDKVRFAKEYAKDTNGTKAALKVYPHLTPESAANKAYRLLKNNDVLDTIEKQRQRMELLASKSVQKFEEHMDSDDGNLSFSASKFVYEQVHGKATQKNLNINASASIEDVLAQLSQS